jgi:DNA-binding MarR family transcriptional regulator
MRFNETLGISYSLKVAENELTYRMDAVLKERGLTSAQYTALSALEAEGPLTNAELARTCNVTAQTMIRITKALESEGLIKKPAESGARQPGGYALTAKALNLVCEAHVEVNKLELRMVEGLSKKDIQAFQATLKKVLENLRDE